MTELLTIDQIEQRLRAEVYAAGGAKKWTKKHRLHMDHALHMIANGSAASLPLVLDALGMEKVTLFQDKKVHTR